MAAWTTIPDSDLDPESPITTSLMQALRDNPVAIAEGASGAPLITGAVYNLFSDITEVGNVGAGEDDLMSYTLPANKLSVNGDRLRVTAYFKGNNIDNVTAKFYFGSASDAVFPGAIPLPTFVSLKIVIDIFRVDGTNQRMPVISYKGAAIARQSGASAAETLSGAIVLKFTGNNIGGKVAVGE